MKVETKQCDGIQKTLIIHVITEPEKGGAELITKQLVKELRIQGENAVIWYLSNPNNCKLDTWETVIAKFNSRNPLNAAILIVKFFTLYLQTSSKIILHCHLTWPLYYTFMCSFLPRCLWVYTEHSVNNKRRKIKIFKYFEKYIFLKLDKIICVSDESKAQLLLWLDNNISEKKICKIPNGSRLFEWKTRKKVDKIRIISIGNLYFHKGFDLIIKALIGNHDEIYQYIIIGDGPEKQNLQTLVQSDNSLTKKVIFKGYKPNPEKYLNQCDIGICPSRREAFGLSAIEMLSSGMPVIASDVSGMYEVLAPAARVCFFKANDHNSLRNKLLNTFSEIKRDNENDRLNVEIFLQNFSIKKMTSQYRAIYYEILN